MDVRRYKTAPPRLARWPGSDERVWLHVLPRAAVDAAVERACARMRGLGCDPEGFMLQMLTEAEVVAASTGIPYERLTAALKPGQLTTLYEQWQQAQEDALPDADALAEALRRGVIKDSELALDGRAAYVALGAADYYGKPVGDCTDGQLAYYALLRAAFVEFYVDRDEHTTKNVSRQWLKRAD